MSGPEDDDPRRQPNAAEPAPPGEPVAGDPTPDETTPGETTPAGSEPAQVAPPPDYGAPPAGYVGPPPGYTEAAPGYNTPPPGYGAPPPGYGPPPPGYGTPAPGYAQPQPGYGQPGYVQPGYPGSPGSPSPATATAGWPVNALVRARFTTRPEARFGVALAAGGVALVVAGILVWGLHFLGTGVSAEHTGGGSHKTLGIVLSLVAIIGGYGLAIARRTGPLVNAGVAASALGVPVLIGFITFDASSSHLVNIDALVLVSIVVWALSYLLVPGAQGHAFYAGAALFLLWDYVQYKAQPKILGTDSASGLPDTGLLRSSLLDYAKTIAIVSLIFGLGYYLIALVLDAYRRSGVAQPFVAVALPATTVGLIATAFRVSAKVEGVLLIVIGLVVAAYAGYFHRRMTCWVAVGAFVLGVVILVVEIGKDHVNGSGIALIIIGLVVVALAAAAGLGLRERDETEPAPS